MTYKREFFLLTWYDEGVSFGTKRITSATIFPLELAVAEPGFALGGGGARDLQPPPVHFSRSFCENFTEKGGKQQKQPASEASRKIFYHCASILLLKNRFSSVFLWFSDFFKNLGGGGLARAPVPAPLNLPLVLADPGSAFGIHTGPCAKFNRCRLVPPLFPQCHSRLLFPVICGAWKGSFAFFFLPREREKEIKTTPGETLRLSLTRFRFSFLVGKITFPKDIFSLKRYNNLIILLLDLVAFLSG